jgi:RNA polymerase sigma factor (TIGR02999 family)
MPNQLFMDGDITKILRTAASEGNLPSEDFLPLVYDELRSLASSHMRNESSGHTLQATALVHEAWLRVSKRSDRQWIDRTHFFRTAALEMRRVLVESARRKSSLKRGSNPESIDFSELRDADLMEAQPNERILLIEEMLQILEVSNPEYARIVTLKFYGGLNDQEVGEIEGLSSRTVRRLWICARDCLFDMMNEEMRE